jgi:hypothetical protein
LSSNSGALIDFTVSIGFINFIDLIESGEIVSVRSVEDSGNVLPIAQGVSQNCEGM